MMSSVTKILMAITAVSGIATVASAIDDKCIDIEYAEEREQYLKENDPNYKTAVIYE